MTRLVPAVLLALALAGCAYLQPAPAVPEVEVLTDGNGMTLYIFDNDVAGSGKSVCNGPCATNWPPQAAGADATAFGKYTIIKRDDGTQQWAYNGKPLYRWVKDTRRGERTGDNFNNVWHIAKP